MLLLLVAGIGYWSRESSIQVDEEITSLTQSEIRHLGIVLRISETAGIMWNEARSVLGYDESDLLNRAARQKLSDLKKDMDSLIKQAQMTRLAKSDEMIEFEAAYSAYWNAIQQPDAPDWSEKRDRMQIAIAALEDWTEREREQNEALARSLNLAERQKVVVTTIAAIVVGLLVAGLTFYEIRRILGRLSRAYRQSSESRDYLQSLFDGLVSGVIVINRDGTVRTVSDSFMRQTGLRRDAVLDRSFSEVFETHDHITDQVSKLLASDTSEGHYLGRVELGRDRLFDLFASPLMISGEYRGLILVLMDITETERAQSELRRNRALAAVGQMTAQIAHEIKNPLGSIRFAAEIMKRSPSTDPQSRKTVEVIDR
ncbi:MAG TPA: PAS domain S-box protein, partial [Blastocatellia bacterium]|nr:PAS domain S-box protein [Blastocatellia bacterium]